MIILFLILKKDDNKDFMISRIIIKYFTFLVYISDYCYFNDQFYCVFFDFYRKDLNIKLYLFFDSI